MAADAIKDVTEKLAGTSVDPSKYELSFKGRGIKLDKAEDAKEIVDAIEKCERMTALRLEGNTVGVDAAEAIAKAIGKHPEFERALWSDMFTGRLKTEIPHALKHFGGSIMGAKCQLVEIDLSDNAFGPNGVVGLVDLLESESCYSLQELKLNNNGLGIGGGKMLAKSLLECHKSSTEAGTPLSLKVFISGRNRLENDGATALAASFKAIGTLELLAMPQNGITHQGISALADAISCNPNLKHLNLNDNTFTSKGAAAMAKALPKLKNLDVINFGDCLIRTDGAKSLAKALENSHPHLKELIVCGNEISKEGALTLACCLDGKKELTKIDFDANMLGEIGCEELRDTLGSAGLKDALGSLSCDEGSEDEEEYDSEGDEEEPEEDEEGEISTDPQLQVKGTSVTPKKQASAKDFLAFPSPSKLMQLGDNGGDAFLEELGDENKDVDKVVATIIKMSLVVTSDDSTKSKACKFADCMLKSVLKQAETTSNLIANAFLVFMGLLKGEDKKYKPPSSINGPLLVLDHVVSQSYFSREAKEVILCFLSKPHPLLRKASVTTDKVLKTLYSF